MSVERKKGIIVLGLVFTLFLMTNVCAGVYFSQPRPYYNYGDEIVLNITVDPVVDGPLKINLFCDGSSVSLFNGPAIDGITIPLTSAWIKDLAGDCYISGEYAGETRKTNSNFKISKKLDVFVSVDSFFAKPGEEMVISGTVRRLSGEPSEGEVEISIPFAGALQKNAQVNSSGNVSSNITETPFIPGEKFYGRVSEGVFSTSFILPQKIIAGEYVINVNAYEKSDSGAKINQGNVAAKLKISQILTSIDAAINDQNFNPGANISIIPSLFDQTGGPVTDQVTVVLIDFEKKRIFEKIVNSGETVIYSIPTNSPSGYYGADISVGDLKVSKTFYINEKAIVSFEIKNGTLVVKNIGNIPYKKDIQIELNGKPFVKRVDLDVGESKSLKLTGITGNYDVKVSDGERELLQSGVSLTGNAIGVFDSKGFNAFLYTPVFWIFLILILVVVVLLLAKLVIKKRSIAYPDNKPRPLQLKGVVFAKKEEKEERKDEIKKVSAMAFSKRIIAPTQAEQAMVVGGEKSRAAIIAIKIKEKISQVTKAELEKAIEPIYSKKGAVYEHGDYIIGIFSPLATRIANNEAGAASAGEQVLSRLNEHNKKFNDKIHFGIAINSGDILNEIRDGKLKFTALGNTIILAKKLSEGSKGKVIISKEAYEKAISEIKADKTKVNEIECYEVRKVVDHEQSKKFIDDFLKRNEKGKTPSKNYSSNPYQSQGQKSNGSLGNEHHHEHNGGEHHENEHHGSGHNSNVGDGNYWRR